MLIAEEEGHDHEMLARVVFAYFSLVLFAMLLRFLIFTALARRRLESVPALLQELFPKARHRCLPMIHILISLVRDFLPILLLCAGTIHFAVVSQWVSATLLVGIFGTVNVLLLYAFTIGLAYRCQYGPRHARGIVVLLLGAAVAAIVCWIFMTVLFIADFYAFTALALVLSVLPMILAVFKLTETSPIAKKLQFLHSALASWSAEIQGSEASFNVPSAHDFSESMQFSALATELAPASNSHSQLSPGQVLPMLLHLVGHANHLGGQALAQIGVGDSNLRDVLVDKLKDVILPAYSHLSMVTLFHGVCIAILLSYATVIYFTACAGWETFGFYNALFAIFVDLPIIEAFRSHMITLPGPMCMLILLNRTLILLSNGGQFMVAEFSAFLFYSTWFIYSSVDLRFGRRSTRSNSVEHDWCCQKRCLKLSRQDMTVLFLLAGFVIVFCIKQLGISDWAGCDEVSRDLSVVYIILMIISVPVTSGLVCAWKIFVRDSSLPAVDWDTTLGGLGAIGASEALAGLTFAALRSLYPALVSVTIGYGVILLLPVVILVPWSVQQWVRHDFQLRNRSAAGFATAILLLVLFCIVCVFDAGNLGLWAILGVLVLIQIGALALSCVELVATSAFEFAMTSVFAQMCLIIIATAHVIVVALVVRHFKDPYEQRWGPAQFWLAVSGLALCVPCMWQTIRCLVALIDIPNTDIKMRRYSWTCVAACQFITIAMIIVASILIDAATGIGVLTLYLLLICTSLLVLQVSHSNFELPVSVRRVTKMLIVLVPIIFIVAVSISAHGVAFRDRLKVMWWIVAGANLMHLLWGHGMVDLLCALDPQHELWCSLYIIPAFDWNASDGECGRLTQRNAGLLHVCVAFGEWIWCGLVIMMMGSAKQGLNALVISAGMLVMLVALVMELNRRSVVRYMNALRELRDATLQISQQVVSQVSTPETKVEDGNINPSSDDAAVELFSRALHWAWNSAARAEFLLHDATHLAVLSPYSNELAQFKQDSVEAIEPRQGVFIPTPVLRECRQTASKEYQRSLKAGCWCVGSLSDHQSDTVPSLRETTNLRPTRLIRVQSRVLDAMQAVERMEEDVVTKLQMAQHAPAVDLESRSMIDRALEDPDPIVLCITWQEQESQISISSSAPGVASEIMRRAVTGDPNIWTKRVMKPAASLPYLMESSESVNVDSRSQIEVLFGPSNNSSPDIWWLLAADLSIKVSAWQRIVASTYTRLVPASKSSEEDQQLDAGLKNGLTSHATHPPDVDKFLPAAEFPDGGPRRAETITDAPLAYIERLIRECDIAELRHEMHTRLLVVQVATDFRKRATLLYDRFLSWCRQEQTRKLLDDYECQWLLHSYVAIDRVSDKIVDTSSGRGSLRSVSWREIMHWNQQPEGSTLRAMYANQQRLFRKYCAHVFEQKQHKLAAHSEHMAQLRIRECRFRRSKHYASRVSAMGLRAHEVQSISSSYVDTQFQGLRAIFVNPVRPEETKTGRNLLRHVSRPSHIVWARPNEFLTQPLLTDGYDPDDIQQGALGDCWLLSALSVAANSRAPILQRVINPVYSEGKSSNSVAGDATAGSNVALSDIGQYTVKLCENGNWVDVTVDERIPCIRHDGDAQSPQALEPIFASSASGRELWVSIIEKAFAKRFGSFESLAGGLVHVAMAELSGGVPQLIELSSAKRRGQVTSGHLWRHLLRLHLDGDLLAAGSPEGSLLEVDELGILSGHAYAILRISEERDWNGVHRLIQLRNPWGARKGNLDWLGDWGNHDTINWTKRMRRKLKFEPKDDGIFWMSFEDFVERFYAVYICRLMTGQANPERPLHDTDRGWRVHNLQAEWDKLNSGGAPLVKNRGAISNPQYRILPTHANTSVLVTLQQHALPPHHAGLFILDVGGSRFRTIRSQNLIADSMPFSDSSMITCEARGLQVLQAGYTLMVCTYRPARLGKFSLSIYSDYPLTVEKLPAL